MQVYTCRGPCFEESHSFKENTFNILFMEEILRSPGEVGSLSHYLQGFCYHPRWLFRISEPSAVSILRSKHMHSKVHGVAAGPWQSQRKILQCTCQLSVFKVGEVVPNKKTAQPAFIGLFWAPQINCWIATCTPNSRSYSSTETRPWACCQPWERCSSGRSFCLEGALVDSYVAQNFIMDLSIGFVWICDVT